MLAQCGIIGAPITHPFILRFVLCTKLCKDAPEMQNPITGRMRAAARTRQRCVFERVKFGRVIAFYMLFTRAQSAADTDTPLDANCA